MRTTSARLAQHDLDLARVAVPALGELDGLRPRLDRAQVDDRPSAFETTFWVTTSTSPARGARSGPRRASVAPGVDDQRGQVVAGLDLRAAPAGRREQRAAVAIGHGASPTRASAPPSVSSSPEQRRRLEALEVVGRVEVEAEPRSSTTWTLASAARGRARRAPRSWPRRTPARSRPAGRAAARWCRRAHRPARRRRAAGPSPRRARHRRRRAAGRARPRSSSGRSAGRIRTRRHAWRATAAPRRPSSAALRSRRRVRRRSFAPCSCGHAPDDRGRR